MLIQKSGKTNTKVISDFKPGNRPVIVQAFGRRCIFIAELIIYGQSPLAIIQGCLQFCCKSLVGGEMAKQVSERLGKTLLDRAQLERKRISESTKDAMIQLKRRGVKLGNAENFTNESRKKGSLRMIENANLNPNNIKASKLISLLNSTGKTLRDIAEELNESGFKTSRGLNFKPEQVRSFFIG